MNRLLVLAGIFATLCFALPVSASTFFVDTTADAVDAVPGDGVCATASGACTLRAAIQEANVWSGDDTITLPSGTYTLGLGDLDVSSVVIVNGGGASETFIKPSFSRGFEVTAGGNLTLNDVTVHGGDGQSSGIGGGIFGGPGSAVMLRRVIVRDSRATFGGGVGIRGTSGMPATAAIIESTIALNKATSIAERGGGGIYAIGNVTLTVASSTIAANTSPSGQPGGGMAMATENTFSPITLITGSTVSGNFGGNGGGIWTMGPTTIVNTTIAGNRSASQSGGAGAALFVSGQGNLSRLVNVTIVGNASASRGAVVVENCSGCGVVELEVQNTIIANNTGAAALDWPLAFPFNCFIGTNGVLTDLGNNLEYPGTTCGFNLPSDVHADPLLSPLARNGGRTQTMALTQNSPALDAADASACAAPPVSAVDQRLEPRPSGSGCDIGAFERQGEDEPLDDDVLGDFGLQGLQFQFAESVWGNLHENSPAAMATADIDNDGEVELIADFPGDGVWVLDSRAGFDSWYRLVAFSAPVKIAAGDLDGSGAVDVLIDFPGFGIWVWMNSHHWEPLHSQSGTRMITADLDANGMAEAIIDFPGQGIWVWSNNAAWSQLHPANGAAMTVVDLDGNGQAELIVDFPGFGLWIWTNSGHGLVHFDSWSRLHSTDATVMATGDIDGNGKPDAIISFPGSGVWARMNRAGWKRLHTVDAGLITIADIDGSGKTDVLISFPGYGIWGWMNDATWAHLHELNPEDLVIWKRPNFFD